MCLFQTEPTTTEEAPVQEEISQPAEEKPPSPEAAPEAAPVEGTGPEEPVQDTQPEGQSEQKAAGESLDLLLKLMVNTL